MHRIINHLIIAIMKEKSTDKLTRNDRLNDCHATHQKNLSRKRIDLRNVTKAFEIVLTKHGARESFFSNWAQQNLPFLEGSFFKLWKKTRRYYHCGNWIGKAFVWSKTQEGYEFWKEVNTDWEKWVSQYIAGNNESRSN